MLRIKIPGGRLGRNQVEAVADIAESWSSQETVHLTTRQDLEIYGLKLEDSAEVMEALAATGLSSFGSCGETVCTSPGQDDKWSLRQWAQSNSVEEIKALLSDLDESWSDELCRDVASDVVFSPGDLDISEGQASDF